MSESFQSKTAVGRISKIGIDVSDLERGAAFWSQVLGLEPGVQWGPYLSLGKINPATFLYLQLVPEGKTAKNRIHFDLEVDDVDTAVDKVLALGGKKLRDVDDGRGRLSVVADPDGNEFCLLPSGM